MVDVRPSWLGKAEDDRLEFKSAKALRHRETIVRAVVSLLNHRGGQVIVGVNDDGVPEGIESLGHEVESLQSTLLDTIEPRPLSLVNVRAQATTQGEVLEIAVKAKRSPAFYAERRNGMYGFWTRSGPTTRALTLAEIGKRLADGERAPHTWKRWDAPLVDRHETEITFVLQAELLDELDVASLGRVFATENRAVLSGGRNMGWTVINDYDSVERSGRKFESGSVGTRKWLSCNPATRLIRFEGSSDFLKWKAPDAIKEPVIYPFPIIEGIASFVWLLRAYASEAKPEEQFYIQLGLWRPAGYRLGPHRPDAMAWQWPARWTSAHDNTSVEKALELQWHELEGDRVARAFATHIYEDFGYDETAVPFWNESEGRFEFPK